MEDEEDDEEPEKITLIDYSDDMDDLHNGTTIGSGTARFKGIDYPFEGYFEEGCFTITSIDISDEDAIDDLEQLVKDCPNAR